MNIIIATLISFKLLFGTGEIVETDFLNYNLQAIVINGETRTVSTLFYIDGDTIKKLRLLGEKENSTTYG